MKLKRFWVLALAFWTLALALWTALIWNTDKARAAERPLPDFGFPAAENSMRSSERKTQQNGAGLLDVPFLSQREDFPTGCESVSAVMALQYFGMEITVEEFVSGYLPLGDAPHWNEDGEYVGCDPREAFPGDPRTQEGWGCYEPVIEKALEQLLREREVSSLSYENLSGTSLEEICREYTDKGIPVLVWATIGMEAPYVSDTFTIEGTGEEFQWLYPLHCLVLVGHDEKSYYFNDPMEGKAVPYPREQAEKAYEGVGRQSLVISN